MWHKKEKKKFLKTDKLFGKQIVETKATAAEIYRNTNQNFVLVAGSKNYNKWKAQKKKDKIGMYLREILYQDQRLGAVQEPNKVSSRLRRQVLQWITGKVLSNNKANMWYETP